MSENQLAVLYSYMKDHFIVVVVVVVFLSGHLARRKSWFPSSFRATRGTKWAMRKKRKRPEGVYFLYKHTGKNGDATLASLFADSSLHSSMYYIHAHIYTFQTYLALFGGRLGPATIDETSSWCCYMANTLAEKKSFIYNVREPHRRINK